MRSLAIRLIPVAAALTLSGCITEACACPPTPAGSVALGRSDTALVVLDFRFGEPQDSARVDPILEAR
jgi:hypothetical protein